jgi:hypothetical protein
MALEQPYTQEPLQSLNAGTQRRLRQVQALGCAGEVPGFRHRDECEQLIQGWRHRFFRLIYRIKRLDR